MESRLARIGEIDTTKDIWVTIVGTVVGIEGGVMLVDDGTGMARVEGELAEEGKFIRAVCRVLPSGDLRAVAVHEYPKDVWLKVQPFLHELRMWEQAARHEK